MTYLKEVPIVGSFIIPSHYKPENLTLQVEGLVREKLEDKNMTEKEGIYLDSQKLK